MQATQEDVAKEAGVSISTVSRVVRNTGYIDPNTREKVLDAIQKLQYRPNAAARRLKSGRTYSIGFIVNDITNSFYGCAAAGAERYVEESDGPDFELFMANTGGDPQKEVRAIEMMLEKRVEGLILASTAAPKCMEAARNVAQRYRIPVVSIDNDLGGFEVGIVTADNFVGGYLLAQHLIETHGHERIGFISGPPRESHARERLEGSLQALAEHQLDIDESLIQPGKWSLEDGHDIMQRWLQSGRTPTAVVSANNFMCIGALYALREAHVRVPEDLALVSFDQVEYGGLLNPSLTTLDYEWEMIGEHAARIVLNAIQADEQTSRPEQVRVPVKLMIRESCGCSCQSDCR